MEKLKIAVVGLGNRGQLFAEYVLDNPNNGMEPYAVSNMFIGEECPYKSVRGYAPMSWITGTASWLYRDLTEGILGITATFDGLKIRPCLPNGWDSVHITRVYRNATYDITVRRGDKKLLCDGKLLVGDTVYYDGKNHCVEVVCK